MSCTQSTWRTCMPPHWFRGTGLSIGRDVNDVRVRWHHHRRDTETHRPLTLHKRCVAYSALAQNTWSSQAWPFNEAGIGCDVRVASGESSWTVLAGGARARKRVHVVQGNSMPTAVCWYHLALCKAYLLAHIVKQLVLVIVHYTPSHRDALQLNQLQTWRPGSVAGDTRERRCPCAPDDRTTFIDRARLIPCFQVA